MNVNFAICPPCQRFVHRHRRLLRWAIVLALVAGAGFWVGANAPTVATPWMCKIYG